LLVLTHVGLLVLTHLGLLLLLEGGVDLVDVTVAVAVAPGVVAALVVAALVVAALVVAVAPHVVAVFLLDLLLDVAPLLLTHVGLLVLTHVGLLILTHVGLLVLTHVGLVSGVGASVGVRVRYVVLGGLVERLVLLDGLVDRHARVLVAHVLGGKVGDALLEDSLVADTADILHADAGLALREGRGSGRQRHGEQRRQQYQPLQFLTSCHLPGALPRSSALPLRILSPPHSLVNRKRWVLSTFLKVS
jgi:hypothetical protein